MCKHNRPRCDEARAQSGGTIAAGEEIQIPPRAEK